ncbi:MAG: membrane protein insertase YidC [Curvibacter sp.]|nr:membrane protein insertase YidC [Curvibacter sp.]
MNDIRRTILWVIFGFSMVLLWDKWQIHNGNKPLFFPSAQQSAPAASASVPAAAASSAAPAAGGVAAAPAAAGASAPVASLPRERVDVSTDVYKLSFDSEGGSLVKAELLQYPDPEDKTQPFTLLDNSHARVYLAQTGLIGGGFPNHKTVMHVVPGPRALADGQDQLAVRFESPDLGGVKLVKTYTLRRGAYDIAVQQEVINTGTAPVSPQLYFQLVRDGNKPAGGAAFTSTFTGAAVYTSDKKYQKADFADIKKNKEDIQKQASDGYIAMVQHYFASAWLLGDGISRELSMDGVDIGASVPDCCYRVSMITPLSDIAPGASKTVEARLYVGPEEEKKLELLTPGLELVKDYGHLTILAKPLYWLLDKLHGFIGNWGWSIMALVVLLKAAFFWLNAKAYASMAKMKAINPKITEMRERLKDKPQQMQQEMMRIYREEKVNPMGGCLPIVIQIPVFIALYTVLSSSVEMSNAPWIGWIHDLSVKDPLYILPVVMTCTSLLQTWLNPTPPDPMQAKMMWIMPLVFSVMFFSFPAGLVLYWITNNVLSIAQQWLINKRLGVN